MPILEGDWNTLIEQIEAGRCFPFLGAGASLPHIPAAKEIAKQWYDKTWGTGAPWLRGYPGPLQNQEKSDLAKVAEAIAIEVFQAKPRDLMVEVCKHAHEAGRPCRIHEVLASLPLNLYFTTNYDDFMYQALKKYEDEHPPAKPIEGVLCAWWERNKRRTRWRYSKDKRYVYYLHGHYKTPESMVLTEDDYLSCLTWMTRTAIGLPYEIKAALSSTLLFIGYSLTDWNFRVLLRSIFESIDKRNTTLSISVQLPQDGVAPGCGASVLNYLERYIGSQIGVQVRVFWISADDFANGLEKQWLDRHPMHKEAACHV